MKETRARDDGAATFRRYGCVSGHKWCTLESLELVYDDRYVSAQRAARGRALVALKVATKVADGRSIGSE